MSESLPMLTVTFVGHCVAIDPTNTAGMAFGRGAELDIDSNPFLHRRVGRFVAHGGMWWLENLGSWTTIRVIAGGSSAMLPGGSRVPLTASHSTVCFSAGSCNYELQVSLPHSAALPAPPAPDGCATATFEPMSLPLTDEQRMLVVALAEPRLRNPDDRYRLPSNRSLARRLGWSDAKFNRKLDHLCRRLDQLGVAGMRVAGRRANDRRLHLVDHMVTGGFVTADDLAALDGYPRHSDEGAT